MAQYYQVVSQPDKSQEETHQYYANEQQTVQYVLTHEDPQQTFQGQQIMVNNQLMVVDNSIPPVIVDVDPSQIQYQPEYVVQEAQHVIYNEEVDTGQAQGDMQRQPVVLNHMQPGPQKILLSLHQPNRPNNQEMTHSVQQPASILNTGHMAAQLRQTLHQAAPQEHQMQVQQQQLSSVPQRFITTSQPPALVPTQQHQINQIHQSQQQLQQQIAQRNTGGVIQQQQQQQQPVQVQQQQVPQNVQINRGPVYRNAVQANLQQVGVQQRPNLTLNQQQNLLNSQQQIGVGVGRAGATTLLRLPLTVASGAPPMRTVLQQHQQQLQVGGVRAPGAIAMGRGVLRTAVGMLQQTPPPPPPPPMQRLPTSMVPQQRQTTPQQQQMMQRAQLQQQHQQQQLGQQPQQQGTSVANSTGTTILQSNGDNKVVQLEDGTLIPIGAYKQMMFNQDQAKQTQTAPNPKPPPKRRAPAKPRAKKTAAQIAASNEITTPANQQQQQQQPHTPMNTSPIYPPPTQNNQPPNPPQIPNQNSPMNRVARTINSIASGMIQNANPEDSSGVSALANFVPSAQIQTIIANTLKNDNYSDSIRMLVLLENGEQRLITFTMPREQCTIQEILEQVNVPFKPETKIEMVEMNCNGLNYVVGVGDVKVNMGTQPSCQPPVHPANPPPPPNNPPAAAPAPQQQQAPTSLQTPQTVQAPPAPAVSPPPTPELPKLVPGRLAICNHCGYLSEDFNRCSRCKRKFPELVKSMAASDVYKNGGKPPQGGVSAAEIAAKLAAGSATPLNAIAATNPNKASAKKKVTKHKIPEPEPVVLLSSDEDDEDEKMKLLYEQVHKNVSCNSMKKEPTSVEITEKSETVGNLAEAVHDAELESHSAILECRTIRVGSFRYSPMESFSITPQHITFKAPTIDNPEVWRNIEIDKRTIVKVLVNFNRLLPVIFYYVTPNAARSVREALNMHDEDSEPYFDPLGKEEAFKRITVLPENFTEAMRSAIKLIYSRPTVILEELSSKEANDILVRTCPRDIKKTVEASNCFTEIRQLLIYPPGKGGISINTEDYMCLAQDQFLNDVIIDFYLQHLVLNLPPEEQEKIHVFSTFFYIRLTTKPIKASRRSQPAELDNSLTPAQKRHARVKNWTKKVDLFEKDFVIVPINESCHWFLAIICYPGMIGYHTMDNVPVQKDKLANIVKKNPLLNTATSTGAVTITQIKKEKFDPKKIVCEDGSTSDKDEAEGDDSEFDSMDGEAEPEEPAQQPKERVPIKQPCILIFDSLAGASRCRVVATLRDYLTCEFKIKRNMDRSFNKDTIKGACPKVPQQTNYTDCGLYLLQYVESFLRNPIRDYHIPINCLKNWFEEMVVTKKREDVSNLIRELMIKHGKDPDMLPEILLPTLNGELFSNYEDEPDDEEEEDEETGEIAPKSKDAANGPSKDPLNTIESEDCNSTTAEDSTPDTDSTPPVRIVRKLWPPPPPVSNNNSSSESPNPNNSNSSCATEDNIGSPSHTPEIGGALSTAAGAMSTQSPSMSSSLSASSLSPGAVTDNSTTTLSDLAPISAIVADVLKEKPTTDRETMSYLKSKRIVRHKPNSSETKKFKPSYPTESQMSR